MSTKNPSAMVPASREAFVPFFIERARRTARLVGQFEDKDFLVSPGEGSMTAAEQVAHICASRNFTVGVLNGKGPSMEDFGRQFDVSTREKALAALKLTSDEVQKAAEAVSAEKWEDEVEPFGPDWRMTRGQTVYLLVEHEVHHTGQLHVYARAAHKVPVMLYAPVDDSVYK